MLRQELRIENNHFDVFYSSIYIAAIFYQPILNLAID